MLNLWEFHKSVLGSTHNTSRDIVIGLFVSGAFYALGQLAVPLVVYYYDPPSSVLGVYNTGFKPATGVIISIDPLHKVQRLNVSHSQLLGEPIMNYTSNENGIMYYIPHLYPKDQVYFTMKTPNNKTTNLTVMVRSNEGSGTEAPIFYQTLLEYSQAILAIVSAIFGLSIFLALNKPLKRYVEKHSPPDSSKTA